VKSRLPGKEAKVIFKGSRYANVATYQTTDANGEAVTALKARVIPPTPTGYFHTYNADERLDLIAFKFYRNPEKFWLIADANTEMDPEDLLEPGRQLAIPPNRT
jgi:nucleoid-associated protein YgaU